MRQNPLESLAFLQIDAAVHFSFAKNVPLEPVKGETDEAEHGAAPVGLRPSRRKETIMVTVNRTKTQARDAQVIAGIEKHLQQVSSLPLVGSTYAPADLVKLIQSRIDSATGASTTKATWHSAVVGDKTLNTKLTPVIRA